MKRFLAIVPLLLTAVSIFAVTASFSFYQESLSQAFADMSTQFNIPIVVDQSMSGQVSLNLSDVTFDEAMNLLCKKAGLFYFEKNGVYFVGSSTSSLSMKIYGYASHTIALKYLKPKDAVSILSAYSSYITYADGEPFLFFAGPENVYKRALAILRSVDKKPATLYVVYNLYEVSEDVYQNGGENNGILSELEKNANSFSSVGFDAFFRNTNRFSFVGSGFAKVGVGKSASFSASDVEIKLNSTVISSNSSKTVLFLNVSNTNDATFKVNSTLSVPNKSVAVSMMKGMGKSFVLEVSVVKTSPNMSNFAQMWPYEKKEKDFYFKIRSSLSTPTFVSIMRYKELALSIDMSSASSSTNVFVGIGGNFVKDLYGYVLVGTSLPIQTIGSYLFKASLIQASNETGSIVSSGFLTFNAPIISLNDFKIDYVGNLEYRFNSLLLGGSLCYSFNSSSDEQSIVPYISGGIDFGSGNNVRILYSPVSGEYKGELEWKL